MTREEALKILMGYSHTTQERAALEVLIPELNENRDERIRKAIRVILIATEDEQKDFYSTHGLTRKDCTDWLEKQERKPAEVDESTKRLNDNWMRQHFDDYQERKSAEWAELQSEFKNINEAFEDGKKEVVAHPEKYGLCKRIEATINGEPIPTENQSVNLPLAEWNPMKFKEGDKVIIHCAPERKKDIFSIYDGQEGTIDAIWDLAANPWGNIKVTLPNGCNNTFYDSELELISKNEPKQEWSEDDKIKLDNCCAVIAQPEVYFDTSSRQKSLDFLYGLPKRFALPPKVEWSEEDKEWLSKVYYAIDNSRYSDNEKRGMKKYIKSLRPQPKQEWSEEDEKIRQSIIKDIEFERNYTSATTGKVIGKYNEQINWLKDIFLNHKKFTEAVDKLWPNEWSEEDKKLLDFWLDVIDRNDWRMDEDFCKASREFINRIKSFRPSWRPTKTMLDALNWARSEFHPDCPNTMENLTYLYKELEQLYYDGN